MIAPVGNSYSCPSGGMIAAGRYRLPLWARSSIVDQAMFIPGSIHSGLFPGEASNAQFGPSQNRLAFSGAALKRGRFILPATGGHGDTWVNAVTAIDLLADSPSWSMLHPGSTAYQADVSHYADGLPSSRHTYSSAHWNPVLNRVMLYGARSVYGSAVHFNNIDGFNLDNNTWDAANTWPSNGDVACVDSSHNGWKIGPYSVQRVDAATLERTTTYTNASSFFGYPAWDTKRDQMFSVAFGDGQGSGSGLTAWRFSAGCTVRDAITFNPSAALTQFLADAPSYLGIQYDRPRDVFWVYGGQAGEEQNLYRIVPNASTVWDVELHVFVAGSNVWPSRGGSSVENRLRYVPELRGFVWMPNAYTPMIYMRTS